MHPTFQLALADEHLYSVPYKQVEQRWLGLYTRASIQVALGQEDGEGIRTLDRAMIVAGPTEELFRHVRDKQKGLPVQTIIRVEHEPIPDDLVAASTRIPRSGAPGITRIEWPAMERWKDANHLLDLAGPGRHVPVEVGRAYDDAGWTQRIVPFEDFLQRAWGGEGEPMYLAQYDLLRQIPDLQKDIAMPDQVWSGVEPMVNVWMGSGEGDLISPPHTVGLVWAS